MKEILINSDIIKYLGISNYKKFIKKLQRKLKQKGFIHLVAQVLEKKDCF